MKLGRTGRWLAAVIVAATAVVAPTASSLRDDCAAPQEDRREQWQNVDAILEALQVRPEAVVADVGAGDGFFTTRLAQAVGDRGRVHAVDVNPAQLGRLRASIAEAGLSNVDIIQGEVDDPKLPTAVLDAALIVNAYHEMDAYAAMLGKIKSALKPDGRLVIIEPISEARRGRPRAEQAKHHEIAMDLVIEDARLAGYVTLAARDPFVKRPHGGTVEWMLVLAPLETQGPSAPEPPASVFSSASDAWKAPELRISMEAFKALVPDDVLVLDVRDPQSYRAGHLPGAILMTPEQLSTPGGQAKLRGERRQIVTYCS